MEQPSKPWSWSGTIDRGPYAIAGLFLFVIKFGIDRSVSRLLFDRQWTPLNYLHIPSIESIVTTSGSDTTFVATLVGIALPFIWIGTTLTVKRLRSTGLPVWLVILFFVPFINLVFFAILCIIPEPDTSANFELTGSDRAAGFFDKLIPPTRLGSAIAAIAITLPAFLIGTFVGVRLFSSYGYSIFVGMPFALGMIAAMLYGYHEERSRSDCVVVSCVASVVLAGFLLLFAIEGAVCIVMAAPLFLGLASLGGLVGHAIQKRPRPDTLRITLTTLLILPALFLIEVLHETDPPLIPVTTSIEIDASTAQVWQHVVSFSELAPPTDWLFKIGIAYPVKARIEGSGVDAVRYCDFSTGSFVEPITVWDEPNVLAFNVASQPHPMQEWTFFKDLDPAHLDGYFGSERGQFKLIATPTGKTILEGTTWYRHRIWPSAYWRLWSDWVLHRIHLRVLRHVKILAEEE